MKINLEVKAESQPELLAALNHVVRDIILSKNDLPFARTIGVMNSNNNLVGTYVIEKETIDEQ